MKNTLILSAIFATLFSYSFVVTPNVAEASCSYNGYLHSGGKCLVSHRGGDDDDRDDDDRDEDERSGKTYRSQNYSNRFFSNSSSDIEYLNRYIQQLLLLLSQFDSTHKGTSNLSDVDVRTQSAISIDEDSATLRAIVDMNSEDTAELYFEYGRSSVNLSSKTARQQLNAGDDGDIQEASIRGLTDNTRYYFRAVAVDENGDRDYGVTTSFLTDNTSNSNDTDPVVTTQSAQSIHTDSAELRGEVDMNDFENGIAFFVYGEDEDQVRDIESDFDTYADVDEDGENLQKVIVDFDVDDTDSFSEDISGLDDSTDIFFSLCVEYDDQNNDETLVCGSVRKFRTD